MKCEFAVLTDPNVHWMQKIKEVDLYSAFIVVPHTQGAQAWITQCYLQITPYTCLYLVSIRQMAHPQTEVADI